MDTEFMVGFLTAAVVAGLAGAAAMAGSISLISRLGLTHGNMLRALGSLITRSAQRALSVGILVHAVAGICFAVLYGIVLVAFGFADVLSNTLIGFGLAHVHGITVSLSLVYLVSDAHPLPEFQKASLAVGASHLFGHLVYGAVVGFVFGLMFL